MCIIHVCPTLLANRIAGRGVREVMELDQVKVWEEPPAVEFQCITPGHLLVRIIPPTVKPLNKGHSGDIDMFLIQRHPLFVLV